MPSTMTTTSRPSGAITTFPTRSWRSWLDLSFRRRKHVLILIGLDPGLATTGWGIIAAEGNRLSHIANGQVRTDSSAPLPKRLAAIADLLDSLIAEHRP